MSEPILPEDVIRGQGLKGLMKAAENYFRSTKDTVPLMKKPFHDTVEGPYLLCKTGLLLSGLRLGKGMTVLDFGAGSCWLSRFLNELHCATISLDPSETALKIGRELFSRVPTLSRPIKNPRFLPFDGKEIRLKDGSVDRIVSLDAFHHVPNPRDLLNEFFRILSPGGIVGFAEVGPEHSQSPASQLEMRSFQVLENDLDMQSIWDMARDIGFSQIYFKPFSHPDFFMGFREYMTVSKRKKIPRFFRRHLSRSLREYPVFFLIKGDYLADSRIPEGLSHRLTLTQDHMRIPVNRTVVLKLGVENSGDSLWLNRSLQDLGTVFIGAHLYRKSGELLDYDFKRWRLKRPYRPGHKDERDLRLKFREKGTFRLVIDLVSEQVCWFETLGSRPVSLQVTVL
jgi:SAM-dependent methyltransferase